MENFLKLFLIVPSLFTDDCQTGSSLFTFHMCNFKKPGFLQSLMFLYIFQIFSRSMIKYSLPFSAFVMLIEDTKNQHIFSLFFILIKLRSYSMSAVLKEFLGMQVELAHLKIEIYELYIKILPVISSLLYEIFLQITSKVE